MKISKSVLVEEVERILYAYGFDITLTSSYTVYPDTVLTTRLFLFRQDGRSLLFGMAFIRGTEIGVYVSAVAKEDRSLLNDLQVDTLHNSLMEGLELNFHLVRPSNHLALLTTNLEESKNCQDIVTTEFTRIVPSVFGTRRSFWPAYFDRIVFGTGYKVSNFYSIKYGLDVYQMSSELFTVIFIESKGKDKSVIIDMPFNKETRREYIYGQLPSLFREMLTLFEKKERRKIAFKQTLVRGTINRRINIYSGNLNDYEKDILRRHTAGCIQKMAKIAFPKNRITLTG